MVIHPKVSATTLGGVVGAAVADLIVWGLSLHGVQIPTNVENDISIIAGAVIAFIAGWITPSPAAK